MVAAHSLMRIPWWTIGLVIGCVAGAVFPWVAESLIYDRAAIADGEWWRLFTGHIVHYSGSHLLNNLMVFLPAALLTEMRSRKELVHLLAVSATAIGLAIWVFEPGILRYAGASGISLGLITYVALRGLGDNPRWRAVSGLVLALVIAKLAAESFFGWQFVDWEHEAGFVTVTIAHVTGVVSGLLVWCARCVGDGRARLETTRAVRAIRFRQV